MTIDGAASQHVYVMNYIDGSMWTSALTAWPGAWDDDVAIAGQLGDTLSRCTVDSYIVPRLQAVLNENISLDRYELRRSVENLISIAPNLKELPLTLSHVDLNATNVRNPPSDGHHCLDMKPTAPDR